jgi:nicotinamidase-related amidase
MDTHFINKYSETQEGKKLPVKHCFKNTPGWLLNKDVTLAIASSDDYEKIEKYTFGSTSLIGAIGYLVEYCNGYSQSDIELTLIGVCTDICVVSNALLLKAHYPEMKIVVDASCCAGSTPEKHYMALEVMKSCQIDVVNNEWDDIKVMVQKTIRETFGLPEDYDFVVKNYGESEE